MRARLMGLKNQVSPESRDSVKISPEQTALRKRLLKPFRVLVPSVQEEPSEDCELVQKAQVLLRLCEACRVAKRTKEESSVSAGSGRNWDCIPDTQGSESLNFKAEPEAFLKEVRSVRV